MMDRQRRKYINIGWLVVLPAVLWLLPACNRKLDLPAIEGQKSIALLGELVANDSVYFRVGQSIPVASGSELQFQVLEGLSVYMTDEQSGGITLAGAADSETQRLYTMPFTSPQKVMPGHKYSIVANHTTLGTASAEVEVPNAFTAQLLDMVSVQYSTEQTMKISFRINDPAATTDYYVIEVLKRRANADEVYFYYDGQWLRATDNIDLYYQLIAQGVVLEVKNDTTYLNSYVRRTMYTDDMNTDNAVEKGIYNRNRRVLLKDKTFNGSAYTSQVYIHTDTSSFSIFERGEVILLIKSVPENYYHFLKSYENFSDAGGFSTFSQPVKIGGNIKNGVGMIGSAYVVRFPLFFDDSF